MRNIIRGFVMGITDLIPGISGGTIALVLGIYQPFIASINGLFSRKWKTHLRFLAPILVGIIAAIISLSRMIEWLIANHSMPLFYFFIGLIFGIIPFLLRSANYKKSFRTHHYGMLIVAAFFVAIIGLFSNNDLLTVWQNLSFREYLFLFFAGWLASSAMILPGISGSFVFLLIGVYPTVIHAISTFQFSVLVAIGFGILLGLVFTSKLIEYLFSNYQTTTFAVMIGLVIGSLFSVFPGVPNSIFLALLCLMMFLSGMFLAVILGRLEHKNNLAGQSN